MAGLVDVTNIGPISRVSVNASSTGIFRGVNSQNFPAQDIYAFRFMYCHVLIDQPIAIGSSGSREI